MARKTTRRRERGGDIIRRFQLVIRDKPGTFAKVAGAIANRHCILGEVDIARVDKHFLVRNVTIYAPSPDTADTALEAVEAIDGVRVTAVTNEVMEAHRGGKVRVETTRPIENNDDFRKIAFPGVLEACRALREDPSLARRFSIAGSTVAVISNGQDVLGLGDIGAQAALPYVEGLAALLNDLGGVSAFPLVIDLKEVYGFVNIISRIAPTFAGVVLGGIGVPDIFKISKRLEESVPLPVFLTGLHGTAVSALAALYKSLSRLGKKKEDADVLVNGTTEAACSTVELLKAAGFEKVIVVDNKGAIYKDRSTDMPPHAARIAEITNFSRTKGDLKKLIRGKDVYVGFSGPNNLTTADVGAMADEPVLLTLGEPGPEIGYRAAYGAGAFLAATRSVVTITHSLCGIIRGTLDAGAGKVSMDMCLAAAGRLAELSLEHRDPLLPVIDRLVHREVAAAVSDAAG